MTIEVDKDQKSSRSKTYLLPLLTKDINIQFNYLLCNCFIKFNRDIGEISHPFGVLYELEDSEDFSEYNMYLINHNLFHRSFIINEESKLFIFHFPKQFIKDYELFKEGKYSKLSTEAKSIIVSYSAEVYKYPPLIQDITGVLWRHKSRRQKMEADLGISIPETSELASRITSETETFNFLD
jgi:hypothetical protein